MRNILALLTCCLCVMALAGWRMTDESRIREALTVIQNKYAPESTIALFDMVVSHDGAVSITGETSVEATFREPDSVIRTDQPEAESGVTLLPSSTDSLTWGMINVSVANMRAVPKHRSELVTQAILGTPVKVLKKSVTWYLIQTPDHYSGWVTGSSIKRCSEHEIRTYNHCERIIFTDLTGTCYSLPDENSLPVSDLVSGCLLINKGRKTGFWNVQFPDGRTGYVSKHQCLPFQVWKRMNYLSTESPNDQQGTDSLSHPSDPDLAGKIIETALKYHGLPYLWGGTSSKGFDCSGFTKTVYFMNGILLQRDASQQALYGEAVDTSSHLRYLLPADLVFFGDPATDSTSEKVTHTGLYIGNGEVIHSSDNAGGIVINSLIPGRENYNEYLASILIRARRILTSIGGPGIEPVCLSEFYTSEEVTGKFR